MNYRDAPKKEIEKLLTRVQNTFLVITSKLSVFGTFFNFLKFLRSLLTRSVAPVYCRTCNTLSKLSEIVGAKSGVGW